VAIRLTKDQATELAIALLAATQNWDVIDITAFRKSKSRTLGDYQLSVTSKRQNMLFQDELPLNK
jgi:hypothetical protein